MINCGRVNSTVVLNFPFNSFVLIVVKSISLTFLVFDSFIIFLALSMHFKNPQMIQGTPNLQNLCVKILLKKNSYEFP